MQWNPRIKRQICWAHNLKNLFTTPVILRAPSVVTKTILERSSLFKMKNSNLMQSWIFFYYFWYFTNPVSSFVCELMGIYKESNPKSKNQIIQSSWIWPNSKWVEKENLNSREIFKVKIKLVSSFSYPLHAYIQIMFISSVTVSVIIQGNMFTRWSNWITLLTLLLP